MKIRWTALALPALLALAAVPRFVQLDLVSVTADEGIHGLAADQISRWQEFPLAGPPSVQIHNTPLFVYALSVPLFFGHEPLAAVAFVAALQLAALALAWRWGARWFGRTAAFVGCALLAASPWMVLYARNMWPPSAVMPLGMALVGFGVDWLRGGGRARLFGLAALAFATPAMHFSGFVAPLWALGVLVAGRRRLGSPRDWAALAGGVGAGLLPWLPWLYFQHFVAHWIDLQALRANAEGKQEFSILALADYFQALLHSGGLRYWFDAAWPDLEAAAPFGTEPLRRAGAGLALAGFALAAWDARRADLVRRALWAWVLLPLALLLLLRPATHPHYLLIACPVPFLLIGDAVARRARGVRRRWLVAGALAALVAGHALVLEKIRRVLDADLLRSGNRYQLTFRQRQAAARSAVDDSPGRYVPIVGFFSGEQPGYAWLHYVETMRRSRGRGWPADAERLYWMDEHDTDEIGPAMLATLRDFRPQFGAPTAEKTWRVGPVRIVRLRRGAAP